MENLSITLGDILFLLGIVVTVGAVEVVISRWRNPSKKLREDVKNKVDKSDFDRLSDKVDKLSNYQAIDHKELKTVELGNEKICKGILAIMDHELTGNSVEKLRKTKDEIQDYLIEK